MRKFSQSAVPHELSAIQKVERARGAKHIVQVLEEARPNGFDGIVTGDES
jgi:hypothetical protein